MDKNIEFKQIILVTDGESNIGGDPTIIAKEGNERGVAISTIGIISNEEKEESLAEIQDIATLGGGVWEYTNIQELTSAMSMVTMKSVYKTIEEAVNKELKEIVGTELDEIHPSSRKKITDVIDKLGDEIDIKSCVIIDCSGSMKNKINIAKSSILNLLRVLNGRKGKTEISVIGYPGHKGQDFNILCNFTENIVELEKALQKIEIGGRTPTASALKAGIQLLVMDREDEDIEEFKEDGILSSNII
ncbi:hypothetical protein CLPU_12c00910 [Gottschalkia purinilytica]|uniref:VWFA domain-containing protein n=1 Tax=Gottschalkia purinilytica TaxID=1503 RepID=A0A0L0W8B8_GOTPU|nr:VWA domain-containing protein [Gottschalkia purinilytica]KNF07818.1 hypothetical protein CLPU_12c00910 [Gottschalkia purinilytica]